MAKKAEVVDIEPARSVPTDEQIARRAYAIFLARGGMHGHDVDDWLRAERELSAADAPMARRPRGTKSGRPALGQVA